jgi:hypothetical protein
MIRQMFKGVATSVGGSSLPPGLQTNLVAWWKLNEVAGTRINSVVANSALDLTPTVPPGVGTGILGNGADFTANTQYLTCADNALLNPFGNGDFSVQFWLKSDTTSGPYIIGQGTGGNYNFVLGFFTSSNTVQFALNNSSSGLFNSATTLITSTGVWYHVVFVANRTGGQSLFYVNGTLQAATGTATFGTVYGGPLIVGNYAGGTTNSAPDGILDEVAYWSRVLTAGEVTQLYNGGAGITY